MVGVAEYVPYYCVPVSAFTPEEAAASQCSLHHEEPWMKRWVLVVPCQKPHEPDGDHQPRQSHAQYVML